MVVAQGGGQARAALGRDVEGGDLRDGEQMRAEGEVGVRGVDAHAVCVGGLGRGWLVIVVVKGGEGVLLGGDAGLVEVRRSEDAGMSLIAGWK